MDSIIISASAFFHFIFGPFALVFGSIVLLVNKGTQNHKRLGYIYLINLPGWHSFPFRIENEWFIGHCEIKTYQLDELLGTKLRALYQRVEKDAIYLICIMLISIISEILVFVKIFVLFRYRKLTVIDFYSKKLF